MRFREADLGAVIDTADGEDLLPGQALEATLSFWAEEAAQFIEAGMTFALWVGNFVGTGLVKSIVQS